MDAAAISESLEHAASRVPDITPLVYEKLFAAHPDMLPLFIRDTSGQVRGEMLQRAIELIFDYLDRDLWASNFIRSETLTHNGYGVPRDVFPKFFDALAASVRELAGSGWTPEMESAWRDLVSAFTVTSESVS